MLRPDGVNFFVCRELTTFSLGERSIDICGFFRRQFIRWLINAGELQENSREIVLRFIRQDRHGLDGLFKQTGHDSKYRGSKPA
jgi:hypothetical protein